MWNVIPFVIERLRAVILVIILAPIAVSTSPLKPTWDEIFFLHNGVCAAYQIGRASMSGLDGCLAEMAKSPIMAFLLAPAGAVQGDAARLNIAPFVLALLSFAQIVLLAVLSARARIPAYAVILAALGAIMSRPLWENNAPFMVDGLLSLVVANTLMLFVGEVRASARRADEEMVDGLLWGAVLSLGILSKLTFGFFAVLLTPIALVVSFRRMGWAKTAVKMAFAALAGIPAGIMLLRYGHLYWAHAAATSFGSLAGFYDDHLSRWAFARDVLPTIVPALMAALCLIAVGLVGLRARRGDLVLATYVCAVVLAYFVLASGSLNKDGRFFWPVWLALPLSTAVLVRPNTEGSYADPWLITPTILSVLLSLQNFARLDLRGIDEAVATLADMPSDGSITVQLATDEAFFNIEALLLAKKLRYKFHGNKKIATVVYDVAHGVRPEQSLAKLKGADYVVARFPVKAEAPEWTNRFSRDFEIALRESGRPVHAVSRYPSISVYGPSP